MKRKPGIPRKIGVLGRIPEKIDRLAVAAALLFMIAYLCTMSVSLDEEDSVHFALALTDFDVAKNQPHPPGFPIYIMLGRLFFAFTGDERVALTSMSAVFGGLTVLAVYVLARRLTNREAALTAAVITGVTPLFWLGSVKAMSDITGLFFIITTLIVILGHFESGGDRHLFIAALLCGLSSGVRIHALLILLPPIVYTPFRHKVSPYTALKAFTLLVAGMAAWLIPAVAASGGYPYIEASLGQLGYRAGDSAKSLIGIDITPALLLQRAYEFAYYFLFGGYGINLWSMGAANAILLIFIAVLALLMLKDLRSFTGRKGLLFLSVISLYLPVVFVALPPVNPRYLLILVPLCSIAASVLLHNRFGGKVRVVAVAALAAVLLSHSLFLAVEISSTPAPLHQLAGYLERNGGDETAVIGSGYAGEYLSYYAPGMPFIPAESASCDVIAGLLEEGYRVFSVDGEWECEGAVSYHVKTFTRDQRVHVKRSIVGLNELSLRSGE
jgi:MFS family permease